MTGKAVNSVFFSSRRRHTMFKCDWSSDVCSSDLLLGVSELEHASFTACETGVLQLRDAEQEPPRGGGAWPRASSPGGAEEGRVGEEWRAPRSPYPSKKKRECAAQADA